MNDAQAVMSSAEAAGRGTIAGGRQNGSESGLTARRRRQKGQREAMRRLLRALKGHIGSAMKSLIVGMPLPLGFQTWAIKWLLPVDPWPKSLAYQQCLADRILRRNGAVVQSGPFKGMLAIRNADEGCLVPKLLGCYEEELGPAVESFMQRDYDRVIDVGCASGYWLTGFALRMPSVEAFGFDLNAGARERCSQLNTLNNVQSRVRLLGLCTLMELGRLVNGRTLLFMDCDGPEYDLLDPDLAPALRLTDIIVECHDYLNPRITPTLEERFRNSHSIERLSSRPRRPSVEMYPGLSALPQEHWSAALDERRPAVQNWLVMRAKHLDSPR